MGGGVGGPCSPYSRANLQLTQRLAASQRPRPGSETRKSVDKARWVARPRVVQCTPSTPSTRSVEMLVLDKLRMAASRSV